MRMRTLCWLGAAIVIPWLIVAVGIFAARQSVDPVIDYPDLVDLGERERGERVVARFTIANRGSGELVVDQIQTNCSCSGVEREVGGRFVQVRSLTLGAGEEAALVTRVSVGGVPIGSRMVNELYFRTNDPARPSGCIQAVVRRVHGGVFAFPESVTFGSVAVGATVRHVVDVHDLAATRRVIERVTSARPERVTARLLPLGAADNGEPHRYGLIIGRIEVTVNTGNADDINTSVEIHLANSSRRPDIVPVVGRIVAPVVLNPSIVFLPRASANGPVYDATCVCRSTSGAPLALTLVSTPPGLTADIRTHENQSSRTVWVRWDPQSAKASAAGRREVIRFRAKAGESELVLELPVLLREDKVAHAPSEPVGFQPR